MQAYAKITDDKISKDMDKLMERREKLSAGEMKENNEVTVTNKQI